MTIFFPRTGAQRARSAMEQERRRDRMERKYERIIAKIIRKSAIAMSVRYENAGELAVYSEMEQMEAAMAKALASLYQQMILAVYKSMRTVTRQSLSKKDADGRISRLLQEWMEDKALRKARSISKTAREDVRKIIARGAEEGLSESVVARSIRKSIRTIAPHRARTIARTETHSAAQHASLEVIKELQLGSQGMKEWVSVEDDRSREDHIEADGQKVPIDEDFSVGGAKLSFPGDPNGPPEQTINCRCVMVYSFS